MAKNKTKKQTKMVGMRVSEDLHDLLTDGAEAEGISATAYARFVLARALNFEGALPETKPRKPPRKKPIIKDIQAAIEVLGLLIDVRMNLSFLSRKLAETHTFNPLRAEQVVEQGERIDAIRRDVDLIRTQILGGRS
ncbi:MULTISPECIES: hypothetical protein [unclassified Ruegeria]|uniref:hypothetical protein n=1 Tax=unclassified Ruegeria TaxID=2625375 RepID=UPI001481C9EC|nr:MULTISPECIES: hypothetical protein [unclassified Ruegeria]